MEEKAVCSYTLTEKLFRNGMRRVNRDTYGPTVKKALIVLALLWAVLAGVTVYSGGNPIFALAELLVLAAAGWTIAVSIPKGRVKRAWAAMQERSGGSMDRTVTLYDDRLEVAPVGMVVSCGDVKKTYETADLLILITADNAGILVPKSGFTKGGAETVLKLLDQGRK